MDQHWIITNRTVKRKLIDGKYQEVVDEKDHTVLPTFRVAKFIPPSTMEVANEDLLRANVEFVPDGFFNRYKGLSVDTDESKLTGSKQLFTNVYKNMLNAPAEKGDTLFFIHGFNSSWTDSLALLQKLHMLYVKPDVSPINQIVLFSWPSYGKILRASLNPRAYLDDQTIAKESGELLGRLFGKTLRFFADVFDEGNPNGFQHCGRKIHLAAHSMGNQVLEEFVASISRHFQYTLFGEVLLLNADVPWDALEQPSPLFDLGDFCERIHVYNHFGDDVLLVSERNKNGSILKGNKRLGRYGPHDLSAIPNRAIVVDTTKTGYSIDLAPDSDVFVRAAVNAMKHYKIPRNPVSVVGDHWGYLMRPAVTGDILSVLGGRSTGSSDYAHTRERIDRNLYRLSD